MLKYKSDLSANVNWDQNSEISKNMKCLSSVQKTDDLLNRESIIYMP